MKEYTWTLDNDQSVWLELLPGSLSGVECLVSLTSDIDAAPVNDALRVSFVEGVYTIPAVGTKPARPGVSCYRALFAGADLTTYLTPGTAYYGISRYGAHYRSVFKIKVADVLEIVK